MNIEKQWGDLKKKYNLPDFKDLDSDFEISSAEETNFPTKSIIIKISEKVDFYAGLVADVLQPDTVNLYAMHETRFFDEAEKKSIYNLYCKLMDFNRKCIELSLMNSEKDNAEFILKLYTEWQELKPKLINVVGKMRESWSKDTDTKEDLEYFG